MSEDGEQAANTDRELWREGDGDGNGMSYYEPSIHVTEQGGIGINVGGTVYVKTLREWHALASRTLPESPRPPDQHNPWDASCSRNLPGEPTRDDARCYVCRPPDQQLGPPTMGDHEDEARRRASYGPPDQQLADVLRRVLEWPLPQGTVESHALPGWLAKEARAALAEGRCSFCLHEWRRHDPEDGMCDAHSDEPGVFGPCRCGREIEFHRAINAERSTEALGG